MPLNICGPSCSTAIPALPNPACGALPPRSGGICRFLFLSCKGAASLPATPVLTGNIVNRAAWEPLFQECDIRISPKVKGSKPKGSVEKARFSSCDPEQVTGRTVTVSFEDYTAFENLDDYEFWDYIQTNSQNLNVGFFTSSGLFYGFYPFSIDVDDEIGDNLKTKVFKSGEITIETDGKMLKPDLIIGLQELALEYLNYDCGTNSYIYDGAPITTLADLYD